MSYKITRDYISFGNARSGQKIDRVRFIVAHDTGNPGSTARNNRAYFDVHQPSASAHTFIDDEVILEIIPLDEKAWHVRYDVSDANDEATGVELCWGGGIDFNEAYNRYVWYMAYLCEQHNLDPQNDIIAHSELDPSRRSDPQNALNRYGISWDEFIDDVTKEFAGGRIDVDEKVKGITITEDEDNLLRIGDRGEKVEKLQTKLNKLGYDLVVDGIFGEMTADDVRDFQEKQGISVDGIVGRITEAHIRSALETPDPSDSKAVVPYPGYVFLVKNPMIHNEDVGRIQRALNTAAGRKVVKVDDWYGSQTSKEVRNYQERHDLLVDGKVGINTWNELF
jgi:N-acetylmuramoyl-L-alanine amidase